MTDEIKPARRWTLGGYAPGGYMCKCLTCSETFIGDKRAIACLPCAAVATEARAQASEALVRELVEGLRPFAKFNLAGFDGEVLEVVPSTPDNPARRIEPIWTSHFRKAQALILRAGNLGSSVVESAASDAARPDCSAAQSLDGGEG